jgi:thioredoxin 1
MSQHAPHLTLDTFATSVPTKGVALLDFTAAWCPPCKAIAPHVDALATEPKATFRGQGRHRPEPGAAERYAVMSVPTLIFLRDGQVVERVVGARPEERDPRFDRRRPGLTRKPPGGN